MSSTLHSNILRMRLHVRNEVSIFICSNTLAVTRLSKVGLPIEGSPGCGTNLPGYREDGAPQAWREQGYPTFLSP